MPRIIDFNTFRAEQKGEPVDLTIGDDTYHLPSSLPAAVAVDAIRMKHQLDDDEDVAVEELDTLGAAFFGPTVWRELLMKHRVSVDELGPLIQKVMEAYSPSEEDADPSPEASTSETAESSSPS